MNILFVHVGYEGSAIDKTILSQAAYQDITALQYPALLI